MDQKMLKRHVLEEVLEDAGLFLPDEESDGSDSDEVGLHVNYRGRGYGPAGFGIGIEGQRRIHRFFVALGNIGSQYVYDQRDELGSSESAGDFDIDRAIQLADVSETDSLGRTATLVYFPGWSLED